MQTDSSANSSGILFFQLFPREEVSKLKLAIIAIARHADLTGDFCTCEVREISQNETLLRLIEVEILQNLLVHTTSWPLD